MENNNTKTVLIKDADYVVTMNGQLEVLRNTSILVKGNQISKIGQRISKRANKTINAQGMIVLPGFINAHHHMFQASLRTHPQLQNQTIDKWIALVCRLTQKMDDETIYYATLSNLAELLLYGCTTTTDMPYIFPQGKRDFFKATIKAASDIGIRFHPYRGSMSLSQKDGAQFPDNVVQDSDTIAQKSEATICTYHDDSPHSMLKIGLAPCTVFTSSQQDYLNASTLSAKHNVNLQTHLGESEYENQYCVKRHKQRPLRYLQSLGWQGKRVSLSHYICVNQREIGEIKKTNTHVVHCPVSNARSPIGAQGIAPIWEMLEKKVNVSIGVDGSAGNDSSNMLEELRWARTIQGARKKSTYLKPMEVLKMGTINGAKALNWDKEIGSIEEGRAADIAIFNPNKHIEHAGATWDPVGSLIACQAIRADTVLVNGKVVVENERLKSIEENIILKNYQKKLTKLIN